MSGYITNLAVILRKAQGVICAETGEDIDVGGEVVSIRQECDAFKARIAELESAMLSKTLDKTEVCDRLNAADMRIANLERAAREVLTKYREVSPDFSEAIVNLRAALGSE